VNFFKLFYDLFGCDSVIAIKYTEKEILQEVQISDEDFTKEHYN